MISERFQIDQSQITLYTFTQQAITEAVSRCLAPFIKYIFRRLDHFSKVHLFNLQPGTILVLVKLNCQTKPNRSHLAASTAFKLNVGLKLIIFGTRPTRVHVRTNQKWCLSLIHYCLHYSLKLGFLLKSEEIFFFFFSLKTVFDLISR